MRLRITDPSEVLIDRDVRSVRAEDASGSFGILDGHADFLTALEISVVSWRDTEGHAGYCAVRNGILSVRGGREVAIATREGHVSDDLASLEALLVKSYRGEREAERAGWTATTKLRMQAIRRLVEALRGAPREFGM